MGSLSYKQLINTGLFVLGPFRLLINVNKYKSFF